MHPILATSPYPTISESGTLSDGYQIAQAEFCRDLCPERVCSGYGVRSSGTRAEYHTCPHGYSVITARFGTIALTINGVVEAVTSEASSEFKKRERDNRKVKKPQVESWIDSVRAAESKFAHAVDVAARDSISALHDIKAIIGTLLKTADEIVWSAPGDSIEDRVDHLTPQLKTIYQSCRFLETLLRLTDIVANPAAARYGTPSPKAIYKLCDMLRKVFEARAAARGIGLTIEGTSFNRPRVYESFAVIPFVLIDNAVKYAEPSTDIRIMVQDRPGESVSIGVSSIGPPVPLSERPLIFARGYRASNARGTGSGLGLYVAQEVAHVNHTRVSYESRPYSADHRLSLNIFSCLIANVVSPAPSASRI